MRARTQHVPTAWITSQPPNNSMFGKHTFYVQNGVVDILRSTEPGNGFQDPLDTDACECLSQWAIKSQIRKGLSFCNLPSSGKYHTTISGHL